MENQKLEQGDSYLYVGVQLNASLSMNLHVSTLYDKIGNKLGMLGKTRHLFDTETTFMFYCSLPVPILDYCDSVYLVASQVYLNKLQKVQNCASRLRSRADERTAIYHLHGAFNVDTLAICGKKHFY